MGNFFLPAAQAIIDMESLIEKIQTFESNEEKSITTKVNQHAACGYSIFTQYLLDSRKNKCDNYRGENCMKITL